MDNPQNKMLEKVEELKNKLKTVQIIPTLSKITMQSFCIGFHLPLTGSLYYLLDNTTAYLGIQCLAKVEHGPTYIIKDFTQYDKFAKSIEDVTAPTTIDFTFNLTNSIYNVNDISMNDIDVTFSVYFLKEKYEVVYSQQGQNEFRLEKQYNEDIEPSEIFELRNKICDHIFDRVTTNIEAVLGSN
jgi:hypothetical protein